MRLTRPWISVLLGLFLLLVNVTSSFAAEVPTQVPAKGVMYTTGGSPVAFEGETPDGVTCVFRTDSTMHSGRIRPLVPAEIDRRFRR